MQERPYKETKLPSRAYHIGEEEKRYEICTNRYKYIFRYVNR